MAMTTENIIQEADNYDDIDVKNLAGGNEYEPRQEWVEHNLIWDRDQGMWAIPGTGYSKYEKVTDQHANHLAMMRQFPWLTEGGTETNWQLFLEQDKVEWMPLWRHFKSLCKMAFQDKLIDPEIKEEISEESIQHAWRQGYANEFAIALNSKFGFQLKMGNPLKEIEDFLLSQNGLYFFNRQAHLTDEYWNTEGKTPFIDVEPVVEITTLDDLRGAMFGDSEKQQLKLNLGDKVIPPAQGEMFESEGDADEDEISAFMRQMKMSDPARVKAFMDEHLTYNDHHEMWELAGFSNFSGSVADRANALYFQKQYPEIVSVGYGGHGTEIYGIREEDFDKIDAATLDSIYRDLGALTKYPILDEHFYAQVEIEMREKAWENWIRNDFKSDLLKRFPQYEDFIDELSFEDERAQLKQLFEVGRDLGGAEWYESDGGDQSIKLSDVLNGLSEDVINSVFWPDQPDPDEGQQEFHLESRPLNLFYGTSSAMLAEIEEHGLRKPFLSREYCVALAQADESVEQNGGAPVIGTVTIRDRSRLRADFQAFEEPNEIVYKKVSESVEVWRENAAHPRNLKDWRTSLNVAGSVRYDGSIPHSDALFEEAKFSCIMAEAPDDIAQQVISWGQMFVADDKIYTDPKDPDGFGRESEVHVTVKYGLEMKEPSPELLRVIEETQPFEIEILNCSIFENELYDVIKFDVEGEGLRALNKRISAFRNGDEHPDYKPHMTVAYVVKGTCRELDGKPLSPEEDAAANHFIAKAVVFSDTNGLKRTLFLGKPNISEAIIHPSKSEVDYTYQSALAQIAKARELNAEGIPWKEALQKASTQEIQLRPRRGASLAGYHIIKNHIVIYVPDFKEVDFEENIYDWIEHEIVHKEQYSRIAPGRLPRVAHSERASTRQAREKDNFDARLSEYFNRHQEVMAHARDHAKKLLKKWKDKKKAITTLKKEPPGGYFWLLLTPKNKQKFLRYAADYLNALPERDS